MLLEAASGSIEEGNSEISVDSFYWFIWQVLTKMSHFVRFVFDCKMTDENKKLELYRIPRKINWSYIEFLDEVALQKITLHFIETIILIIINS